MVSNKASDPTDQLSDTLNLITGLLACLVRKAENQGEQIAILDNQGLSSSVIARALGVNAVTVRTTLHRLRKGKKRAKN